MDAIRKGQTFRALSDDFGPRSAFSATYEGSCQWGRNDKVQTNLLVRSLPAAFCSATFLPSPFPNFPIRATRESTIPLPHDLPIQSLDGWHSTGSSQPALSTLAIYDAARGWCVGLNPVDFGHLAKSVREIGGERTDHILREDTARYMSSHRWECRRC